MQVDCEPISLPEAKSWLQIDYPDWDAVIQDELIPASRIESERATGMLYTERQVTISNNKTLISPLPFHVVRKARKGKIVVMAGPRGSIGILQSP